MNKERAANLKLETENLKLLNINEYIEHTILKQDTCAADVKRICAEAIENNFFGVCIPPYFVKEAALLLQNTEVKLITVVGFPLGYQGIAAKVEETKRAIDEGADEIDMVMNVAAFKDKNYNYVKNELLSVCTIARMKNKKLKVIIETALLNDAEIIHACELCEEAEVDFVKTSTGFSSRGASVADIVLMRKNLSPKINIKASGGIKTKEFALQLIEAGATRIGTSCGLEII